MIRVLFGILFMSLAGCQTTSYGHVQVGSTYPSGNCREVAQVIGNAASQENSRQLAIDDMRHNAALLEANYVRLMAVAAYGKSARGIAYRCQ